MKAYFSFSVVNPTILKHFPELNYKTIFLAMNERLNLHQFSVPITI